MNLEAIREAIVATVKESVGEAVNGYAYLPSSPSFPYIAPISVGDYVAYHETFDTSPGIGGASQILMDLLIVESGDSESAGRFVDSMLSTGTGSSAHEAIEADKTLGGVVQSCICRSATIAPFGLENVPGYVGRIRLAIITMKEPA